MKSSDNEAKYAAAVDYYQKKDYYRAIQLFQPLINFYKGTEKAELMQYYFADSYYNQGDYVLASYYFKRFREVYPRSKYAEQALFMAAYCYYLDSPRASLDQSNTYEAISQLQLFMDAYPKSDSVEACQRLITNLENKLELKDYNLCKLYYKMAQYEAAITAFRNLLKDYPDTRRREEILYYIFKSNYYYAINSIATKQEDRFQATIDSYNELIFQYPDTRYKKDVMAMYNYAVRKVENL
jgi:outer membrane protein assembly factor BamD